LLAGAHALIFRWTAYGGLGAWDEGRALPWGAKLAGASSILIWVGVVAAGRFIGFI